MPKICLRRFGNHCQVVSVTSPYDNFRTPHINHVIYVAGWRAQPPLCINLPQPPWTYHKKSEDNQKFTPAHTKLQTTSSSAPKRQKLDEAPAQMNSTIQIDAVAGSSCGTQSKTNVTASSTGSSRTNLFRPLAGDSDNISDISSRVSESLCSQQSSQKIC
jgi:hypothetical protein